MRKLEIEEKEWEAIKKRIADLEGNQMRSAEMVEKYILDSETASNRLSREIEKMIQELPMTIYTIIQAILKDDSFNK